jgi:hypothetical protein
LDLTDNPLFDLPESMRDSENEYLRILYENFKSQA